MVSPPRQPLHPALPDARMVPAVRDPEADPRQPLEGHVAVVLGVGGIGSRVAEAFHSYGADVVAASTDREGGGSRFAESTGIDFQPVDVMDPNARARFLDYVTETRGQIHSLQLVHGKPQHELLTDFGPDHELFFNAPQQLVREARPLMMAAAQQHADAGVLFFPGVNVVTSIAAIPGSTYHGIRESYRAAKAQWHVMLPIWVSKMAPVRLNLIAPGRTDESPSTADFVVENEVFKAVSPLGVLVPIEAIVQHILMCTINQYMTGSEIKIDCGVSLAGDSVVDLADPAVGEGNAGATGRIAT